jgi:dienelactone hydrolase
MRTAWLAALAVCALSACSTRSDDVRFRNGDVTLAGTLIMPTRAAPHPAIVLVHGDGPDTRGSYRYLADQFAAGGIAALIYDKRGAGQSSGQWPARFDDLAADAVAAIDYLRTQPDIDSARIGIWGGSQGGWIAPLAATAPEAGVRCVVIKAGPGVGPADLARWKSVTRVSQAGYPLDVAARVQRLMDFQFAILRTGVGWEELDTLVHASRAEPWFPLVAVMRHSEWRSSWMTYGPDIDFDPATTLMKVDAPILWILGERDPETPLHETLETIRRLQASGKDITVNVVAGADHQIELPRTRQSRPNYAPGYIESTVRWVSSRCAARSTA